MTLLGEQKFHFEFDKSYKDAILSERTRSGQSTYLWYHFRYANSQAKLLAAKRLSALYDWHDLVMSGAPKEFATAHVAKQIGVSKGTIRRWRARLHGVDEEDFLPALCDWREE